MTAVPMLLCTQVRSELCMYVQATVTEPFRQSYVRGTARDTQSRHVLPMSKVKTRMRFRIRVTRSFCFLDGRPLSIIAGKHTVFCTPLLRLLRCLS